MHKQTSVYKATNIYGETCHFGFLPLAKAWAKSGTVEEVPIYDDRPTPQKRRVSYVCPCCNFSMIRNEDD